MTEIGEKIENQLRKAQYGIYNHSAVQICSWTKKSLRGEGICYKQEFYGADTHSCMEFSPAALVCENNCVFCWRPMEFMRTDSIQDADEPETIVENLLGERYKLLSGFPGGNVDMTKFRESVDPTHFAISLSGEPAMYPKLPELILYLRSRKRTRTIFLVTNGQEPEMLRMLQKKDALPTQLYISTNAPNPALFSKINCPTKKDAWKRYKESLTIASKLKTRRVMRMTMIKGMNMEGSLIPEYAKLIEIYMPHFIEVKAYMHLGFSQKRLKKSNMPYHEDIAEYSEKLAKATGFEIINEKKDSRIVLLRNGKERIDPIIRSVKWE